MTENMKKDTEKEVREFKWRLNDFPDKIQNRLLFIHHYIRQIVEEPNNMNNTYVEVEIDKVAADEMFISQLKINGKTRCTGKLTECWSIPKDDLDCIYNIMIEVLREASDLIELDMTLI